ncbi:MAG TPA: hypothetical protein VFC86_06210 [Planctomycetota bacterium]|nr:hypothetical protein [Planctomycetota bacterium]
MKILPTVVMGLALAAPAQDRSAYNEALLRFNAYLWENRLSLADWCKANGLVREARGHYQFIVLNGGTGNPFTSKAQAKLRGDWKSKPSDANPEKWAKYRERLHEYFRELGTRAWRIHAAAEKAKLTKEADDWLAKTVHFYLDQPEARAKRGEEKVEAFGWVPQAEAEQARKAVDPSEDLSAKDEEHRSWDRAWVIRSPHFLLRTTVGNREAARILDLLEKSRTVFFGTLGDRMKAVEYRVGLYLFATNDDVEAARLAVAGASIGYFNPVTNIAYLRAGDENTLLHELTHQLAHNAMGHETWSLLQQADVRSDSPDNYWVMEGLAVYFGGLKIESGGPVFQGPRDRSRLEPPALRDFLGYDHAGFAKNPGLCYAIAGELTRYLMEANGGKRRDAFLDFVREYYLGNSSLDTLEKSLGLKIPDLEREFVAWLKDPE